MNITDHYINLGEHTAEILKKSLSDENLTLLSTNHAFLYDFANWLDVLQDRPEISIFRNAVKEYQMAILSNNLGLYQQAFMGLRFFFERTLVAILFSANEIELNPRSCPSSMAFYPLHFKRNCSWRPPRSHTDQSCGFSPPSIIHDFYAQNLPFCLSLRTKTRWICVTKYLTSTGLTFFS
ncbi:MAG: hypothetical protein ACKV1O_09895 [Saprospiraceae bacterium]